MNSIKPPVRAKSTRTLNNIVCIDNSEIAKAIAQLTIDVFDDMTLSDMVTIITGKGSELSSFQNAVARFDDSVFNQVVLVLVDSPVLTVTAMVFFELKYAFDDGAAATLWEKFILVRPTSS